MVALGVVTVGTTMACTPVARMFGFGATADAGARLEVRNNADVGANLYLLPRSGIHYQPAFVGVVGPRTTRTFRIRGSAPGDTVSIRVRPVDGSPEYVRNDVVLGGVAVWQIP